MRENRRVSQAFRAADDVANASRQHAGFPQIRAKREDFETFEGHGHQIILVVAQNQGENSEGEKIYSSSFATNFSPIFVFEQLMIERPDALRLVVDWMRLVQIHFHVVVVDFAAGVHPSFVSG